MAENMKSKKIYSRQTYRMEIPSIPTLIKEKRKQIIGEFFKNIDKLYFINGDRVEFDLKSYRKLKKKYQKT